MVQLQGERRERDEERERGEERERDEERDRKWAFRCKIHQQRIRNTHRPRGKQRSEK